MNKKRSRLEVIFDILKTINSKNGKIKPTHILYKSNLSHKMMAEYMGELITKDFIKEIKNGTKKTYSITSKGQTFLSEFKVMEAFMDSFGLE